MSIVFSRRMFRVQFLVGQLVTIHKNEPQNYFLSRPIVEPETSHLVSKASEIRSTHSQRMLMIFYLFIFYKKVHEALILGISGCYRLNLCFEKFLHS